jgi:hypothetical protein
MERTALLQDCTVSWRGESKPIHSLPELKMGHGTGHPLLRKAGSMIHSIVYSIVGVYIYDQYGSLSGPLPVLNRIRLIKY